MKNVLLGLLSALTAVAATAARPLDSDHAQPFYLEQTVGMRGDDGWTAARSLWVIARQADGTTVRSESRGPDAEHRLRLRNIYYPDDHYVTLYDAIKLKTTWRADHQRARWERAEDPSPSCDGDERAHSAGLDSVLGELVVKSTVMSTNGYRYTAWKAPKLACEKLYSRAEKVDGESSVLTVETITTKMVLGDPDPTLFAIPLDYVETKPSEALMKAISATGLTLPEDERQRIVDEGAALDKDYGVEDVYRPGNGVTSPRVIHEEEPTYPSAARAARVEGNVLVECVVGITGSVNRARIVRSVDTKYGVDDAVLDALRFWRFEPGTKDGKPVPVLITIDFPLTLK